MGMSKESINIMGLSIELIGLVFGGWIIGQEIDKFYNLNGMGLVGGILLALFTWFMHVIKAMKRMEADEKSEQ